MFKSSLQGENNNAFPACFPVSVFISPAIFVLRLLTMKPYTRSLVCVLGEANTDLHIDGCVPLDESPFIVADPVVVHAVPSVQHCPVCGQLDHHILSGITAGGLVHLCGMKQKAAK